jgi:hypothetical protein
MHHAHAAISESHEAAPAGDDPGVVDVGAGAGAVGPLELRLEEDALLLLLLPTTAPAATAAATIAARASRNTVVCRRFWTEGSGTVAADAAAEAAPGVSAGTGVASTRIDSTGSASSVTSAGSLEGERRNDGSGDLAAVAVAAATSRDVGGSEASTAAAYEGRKVGGRAHTISKPGDAR